MIDVTFLTPTGHMDIRLSDEALLSSINAAETLKAKFFVVSIEDGAYVYDATTKKSPEGVPLPVVPLKSFPVDQHAAAVMWAELHAKGVV